VSTIDHFAVNERAAPSGYRASAGRDGEPAEALAELALLPVPLLRLDAAGRVERVNDAWLELARALGGRPTPAPALGQDYVALARELSASLGAATARVLASLPHGPGASACDECRCEVGGTLRWLRLEARRCQGGVSLLHLDISPQRRAEAHLHLQALVSEALAERKALVRGSRALLAATCEELGWEFGCLWVRDHWDKLLCADLWVDPRLAGGELENVTRTTSCERGHGLAGRAWQAGSPTWLVDVFEVERFPRRQQARALGLKSGFWVPLSHDDHVVAVFEFMSTQTRLEDRELLELLSSAGARLAAEELRARARASTRAAEATAMPSRRLEAVFETMPGFVFVVDAQGKLIYINRVMAQHRRDEVAGKHWLEHVQPSQRAELSRMFDTVMTTGVPQRHKGRLVGPDGREMWLSSHLGPMREDGKIVGVIITAQDVTELERAQSEIAASQRWVSVGTLAAGMAHEINTPVQFVSDNLLFIGDATRRVFGLVSKLATLPELIVAGASDGELREAAATALQRARTARLPYLEAELPKALEACITGLERVATIVGSLEEFAHPLSSEMEQADVNQLIERALAIASGQYRYVAELATELGELPPVLCYVGELTQALLNIIMNAAQAIADAVQGSERKGTLSIRTWRDNDEVVIAVRDDGVGIPEPIRPRIFDPFFTTRALGKGTGQGLAVAWAVIEKKHRGSLTFESSVGKGSTFFVRLPALRASARP
jgi:two-component system, NtrC family, sensor kinase